MPSVIDQCIKLKQKNRKLRKQVKIMKAALCKIAEDFGTDYADGNVMVAYDALEKIK